MTIFDKDTTNLMDALQNARPSDMHEYIQEQFEEGEPDFPGYINMLLSQKGLKRQDVLIKENLTQKYCYKLLSGESHTTDRDKILRICFSMEMTLKETQRALKLYGMSELYPKIKRDVLLIVAIGQKTYDIDQVNDILKKEGQAPLYDVDSE